MARATRRSAGGQMRRLLAVGLVVGVAVLVGAWSWDRFGPAGKREREIGQALQLAIGDCGTVASRRGITPDENGEWMNLSCGAPDNLGQFVVVTDYPTSTLATAGFRREASDPDNALCRTSTEVFVLELFWPDGMDPRANEHERFADRLFCSAVGAGPPRYAAKS